MNALATWFLVLSAHSAFGGAFSQLGPLTIEQCRAGESAIGSASVHCKQAKIFTMCPTDEPGAMQVCPVFDTPTVGAD